MVTMTAREFNQDTGRAKTAAKTEPVVITDRGKPSHVLLSYEDYERLSQQTGRKTVAEAFFYPGAGEIEIEFPRLTDRPKEIDFD
jgi:hypothetical protein